MPTTLTEEERLVVELEFVQCLANPAYLTFLAQNGHLDDAKFLAYLRYLQYWHQPAYARYIQYYQQNHVYPKVVLTFLFSRYPNALFILDRLLDDKFRGEVVKSQDFVNFLHKQQYYAWEHGNKIDKV